MDILLFAAAYLLGSVPFALVIGKKVYQIDIREHGSGNLGTTNAMRVLGKKAGIIVMVLDILKGVAAAALPWIFQTDAHALLIGLGAIIGHSCSVYIRFGGGKAVATTAGVVLFYHPVLFLIALAAFLLVLKVTKYVSLASIAATFVGFLYSWFEKDEVLVAVLAVVFIFVTWKHRSNIERIQKKTEPKVKWI